VDVFGFTFKQFRDVMPDGGTNAWPDNQCVVYADVPYMHRGKWCQGHHRKAIQGTVFNNKQIAHLDFGDMYRYPSRPWTPGVMAIKRRVEQLCGRRFNHVVINFMVSNDERFTEHRDATVQLETGAPIAIYCWCAPGPAKSFGHAAGSPNAKSGKPFTAKDEDRFLLGERPFYVYECGRKDPCRVAVLKECEARGVEPPPRKRETIVTHHNSMLVYPWDANLHPCAEKESLVTSEDHAQGPGRAREPDPLPRDLHVPLSNRPPSVTERRRSGRRHPRRARQRPVPNCLTLRKIPHCALPAANH
jgi:hypothetical protein